MARFRVSPSQLKAVLEYVQAQREHHRTRSFQERIIARLLRQHGIVSTSGMFGIDDHPQN
jgi:hypothetical protein